MAIEPLMRTHTQRGESGVVAVEFALVLVMFLMLVFLVLEMARIMYLWNTLGEVTRVAARAAAMTDFADAAAMDKLRQRVLLRDSPGKLGLGGAIDDTYVRIDYLTATLAPIAVLPATAVQNVINCTAGPSAANCIRFVRVRICVPGSGTTCTPVPYRPVFPLLDGIFLEKVMPSIPRFDTVVPAELLGFIPAG
jgi:hypothetical protein